MDNSVLLHCQAVQQTVTLGTVVKVRLSDGALLDRMLVPKECRRLLVTPDGGTLLALAVDNTVMAVDLP